MSLQIQGTSSLRFEDEKSPGCHARAFLVADAWTASRLPN